MDINYVAKRIYTLRNSRNKSARKVSLELGETENYIGRIENGKNNITMPGFLELCDYFEITPSEFFDEQVEYPLEYRKLIAELNKLSPNKLEKLMEFIKEFITND